MPVVRLYYEDLEQMVGAPRDSIMNRLAMMGADIGKTATENYVDVEFFPDRPDLYSSEGVARALQGFLGIKEGLREYQVTPGNISVEVDQSVKDVRPLISCAVVRGLEFSDEAIESLMNLQEDLHWGLGRNRRQVAIGVHDISRIKPDGDDAVSRQADQLVDAVKHMKGTCLIVSNEVGLGIVPDNALARRFRDLAGCVNQKVAQAADEAYLLASAIPVKLK